MAKIDLASRLTRKGANSSQLADQVMEHPQWLPQLLAGLEAEEAPLKYACAKVLRLLSAKAPELLYPHVDYFIGLLRSGNQVVKWEAIRIVAQLAPVDTRGRVDQILSDYLEPIRGPAMVTAANTIESAATIALAKPQLAPAIARAILKVEWGKYQTDECRQIAIGHAIEALDRMFEQIANQTEVLEFARRQAENPRNSTRKKVADFLKRRDRTARPG